MVVGVSMFGSVRLARRHPVGYALVAARNFQKKETVLKIIGRAGALPTRTSICVGEEEHVENEVIRFVNHACKPTTTVEGRRLVASRKINAGERNDI